VACLGGALQHGQSAEVLVQCCENSSFLEGEGQNNFVAWVFFPITAPNNVMPSRL
jgi:hypothetical protein